MTAIVSLCGATDCDYSGVSISMTMQTLALVLDGAITSWSSPAIVAVDDAGATVATASARRFCISTASSRAARAPFSPFGFGPSTGSTGTTIRGGQIIPNNRPRNPRAIRSVVGVLIALGDGLGIGCSSLAAFEFAGTALSALGLCISPNRARNSAAALASVFGRTVPAITPLGFRIAEV